jgi:disulfide bond formation protein DsbB
MEKVSDIVALNKMEQKKKSIFCYGLFGHTVLTLSLNHNLKFVSHVMGNHLCIVQRALYYFTWVNGRIAIWKKKSA